MISDAGQNVVQILADIAGAPVLRADSKHDQRYAPLLSNVRAFNDGTNIVVRPEIADNLVRLAQQAATAQINPSMQLWKNTARDLYAFAHEMGHFRKGVVGGTPEQTQAVEQAANIWAFNHMKPIARKLGLSQDQARMLYRSLPKGFRVWSRMNPYSPDTQAPPKRLGG